MIVLTIINMILVHCSCRRMSVLLGMLAGVSRGEVFQCQHLTFKWFIKHAHTYAYMYQFS